jgi:hypothetical protein
VKATSHPLENERRWAHNIQSIERWFYSLRQAVYDFGILDEDIWNYDETGFQVGIGGKETILCTKYSNKRRFHGNSNNRDRVSLGEFIRAKEETIEPFVIVKDKIHLEKYFFPGGFSSATAVAHTETGYFTTEQMIPLLEHFERQTAKRTADRWRLLI